MTASVLSRRRPRRLRQHRRACTARQSFTAWIERDRLVLHQRRFWDDLPRTSLASGSGHSAVAQRRRPILNGDILTIKFNAPVRAARAWDVVRRRTTIRSATSRQSNHGAMGILDQWDVPTRFSCQLRCARWTGLVVTRSRFEMGRVGNPGFYVSAAFDSTKVPSPRRRCHRLLCCSAPRSQGWAFWGVAAARMAKMRWRRLSERTLPQQPDQNICSNFGETAARGGLSVPANVMGWPGTKWDRGT